MNPISNPILPSKSPHYEFIGSENKVDNKRSSLKHKFKWKDKEYTITWENPQGIISEQDTYKYISLQLDKILILVERHLYVNNKYLKCNLELDKVYAIKKKTNGSETEKRIPHPFDITTEVKALTDKKQNANSLEKAKRQSLDDKLNHAQEAAKMLEVIGNSTPQNPKNDNGLDKLGHLKIEKTEKDKVTISFGPFGYLVKLIVDLVKWIMEKITKLWSPST